MHLSKILLLVYSLFVFSCVSSRAPEGSLPDPEEFVKSGYGGWMTIKHQQENITRNADGEFIAIDSLNLYILTDKGTEVLPFKNIQEAWLELHGDSKKGMVGGITFLGILSTISHGAFLVFSAPIWLLSGSSQAVAESKADIYKQENPSAEWWYKMKKFSRFPQGLPAGLQLDAFKIK